MYTVTNISNSNVFAGNVNLVPGQSTNTAVVTTQLALAVQRGLLSTNPALPASSTLVDNTGGTPSTTIIAVPAAYTQAELANALSSLIAMANANAAAIANLQSATTASY